MKNSAHFRVPSLNFIGCHFLPSPLDERNKTIYCWFFKILIRDLDTQTPSVQ